MLVSRSMGVIDHAQLCRARIEAVGIRDEAKCRFVESACKQLWTLCLCCIGAARGKHDDLCANRDAIIEIDDVLIHEAHAAG